MQAEAHRHKEAELHLGEMDRGSGLENVAVVSSAIFCLSSTSIEEMHHYGCRHENDVAR